MHPLHSGFHGGENRSQRMVGGEMRKPRRPFAVTDSKASANSRRAFSWSKPESSGKNTNLNGLTSFILPNASNSTRSWGKYATSETVMTIASSENMGDVMVMNALVTVGPRRDPSTQATTCRDRRALSRDRSNSGNEGGSIPVHHQLESMDKPMHDCSPTEPSIALNRSVSMVSAQASSRAGTQPAHPRRST